MLSAGNPQKLSPAIGIYDADIDQGKKLVSELQREDRRKQCRPLSQRSQLKQYPTHYL